MFTVVEGRMKKQTCVPSTTSSALAMQKDSQIISKEKPKIRIIHIFAPEIIKTDVENFRELVQRLTGKPTETNTKKKPRIPGKEETRALCLLNNKPLVTNKMELRTGFRCSEFRERFKGEEEMWGGGGGGGSGFLGGFADLDGFMQQLNEFPLLPLDTFHMNAALGETTLLS